MQKFKNVILGGGMAAGYAAREFARKPLGPDDLMIISADNQPPYERPPLSKDFLAGKKKYEEVLINEPLFYDDRHIGIWLETNVVGVDLESRVLTMEGGAEVAYEKLLIATGARPRTLAIPGGDSPKVFYLRSLDDSRRLREQAEASRRVLVLGGGFIGMETAAVFAGQGLEVTMVFPQERVWENFFTEPMSHFFEKYYAGRGVRILAGRKLARIESGARELTAELDSGQHLAVDFVVAGVGVEPVVDIFRDTPLKIENGIVVNEYLETNVPGVYAAGDVANWRDVIFGKQRRVEHWDNAVTQGPHAARVMLGRREPYIHVPYFFSDEFDLSYEFWGDIAGAEPPIHRGDVDGGEFSAWWLREGRLVGAFIMNRPDEERELAQRWIAEQQKIPMERLRDESLRLAA